MSCKDIKRLKKASILFKGITQENEVLHFSEGITNQCSIAICTIFCLFCFDATAKHCKECKSRPVL